MEWNGTSLEDSGKAEEHNTRTIIFVPSAAAAVTVKRAA